MNERARRRRRSRKRLNVRHHVVPKTPLKVASRRKVDVVDVGAHLLDPFIADERLPALVAHTQFALRLGQREPELSPGAVAPLRRPQFEHRLRCVPLAQR